MKAKQTLRRQVAIAGFVADGLTTKPLAGAEVVMTSVPPAFARTIELFKKQMGDYEIKKGRMWDEMAERPDKTRSREDGLFYFLGLPDGEYGLKISARAYGKRYGQVEQKVVVARAKKGTDKEAFTLDWARVSLPPTAVRGVITSKKVNVGFAQVRVKGSGECVLSDATGRYLLTRIEPGERTVLVNAQGYRATMQTVVIGLPGEEQVLDFNLAAERG